MLFPANLLASTEKIKIKAGRKKNKINRPRLTQKLNLQPINEQKADHQTQKYSNIK